MNSQTSNQAQTITRYEGFLRRDPSNPLLLISLGDLYHQSGDFERALACYEKCIAAQPGHALASARVANVMISQHRFAEAEQALRRLLEGGDADPALLHNLGLTLYCQQRWQEAADAFQQAHAIGLDSSDNALYRAYALHRLGDMERAIAACQESLALQPNDAVNGYLALLEMDKGDIRGAHERAREVLKKQPDNTDAALVEGIWLTEQQEVVQAQQHFGRIVQREPDNPRAWLGMGLAALYRGEHQAAIAAFETALKYTPGHAGTMVTLGWARIAQRDLRGAEQTFREAIVANRAFGEAHGGLAVTLVYQGRLHEARRRTAIAQRLDPQSFGALYARSALLALDGKRAQGEAEVAAALLRPHTADGRTLFDHIHLYLRRNSPRSGADKRTLPKA